ncbi:CubicO group peptidase (beta-lactamase class C family) [Janthinobacterium sp. CG_23.3]|uniref:serine hydrolase domain-containing protein n=1 Tax=Janthinobacterium sp. CG_23.3 TaxID=3349634 RepID=UPI0038D3E5F4
MQVPQKRTWLLQAFVIVPVWFGLSACTSAAMDAPSGNAVYPGKSWQTIPTTSLDAKCSQELDATRSYLTTQATTALVAVQDGRTLFSYGAVDSTKHHIASARKSVLAMMFGKYVENGNVDLDKTMADIGIDDVGGLLPIERQARLHDLLSARSGVYHPAANGGDKLAFAPPRGSQVPGAYFLYNNWDFNAAGSAFEMLTQKNIYQAFADDLAGPLQLEDFNLKKHRRGGDHSRSEHMAYTFYLSARDLARLGYLMLEHGQWRGKQIIPADWVAKISRSVTPSADMHPASETRHGLGYSYLWWTLEEPEGSVLQGAYTARGHFGQYLLVVPKRHMVIAHKREVPPGTALDADLRWVRWSDFLVAARMLAAAPCGGGKA